MKENDHASVQYLFEMFSPFAVSRMAEISSQNRRFVHYTSAATGLSIIKNEKVWLRSALLMNDFQEVEHGQQCVRSAWNHELLGVRIKAALQRIDLELWQRVVDMTTKRIQGNVSKAIWFQ